MNVLFLTGGSVNLSSLSCEFFAQLYTTDKLKQLLEECQGLFVSKCR